MARMQLIALRVLAALLVAGAVGLAVWGQHVLDTTEHLGPLWPHQARILAGGLAYGGAVLLFALALAAAHFGRVGREALEAGLPAAPGGQLSRRAAWLLAGLVLAAGIAFRLYHIEGVPYGLNNDSAWYGCEAIDFLHGAPFTFYTDRQHEVLHLWSVAGWQALVGYSSLAIKLSTTFYGILFLFILYGFARRMFSPGLAVVVVGLAASSWLAVLFARSGWRAGTMPVFQLAAVWALWEADQRAPGRGKLGLYVLAGLVGGLSLHTYMAARTLPLLFGIYLLYRALTQRRWLRENWLGLVCLAVVGAAVAAPLVYIALTQQTQLWRRFAQIRQEAAYFSFGVRMLLALGMFHFRGNGNDWFVDDPLLDRPLNWFVPFGLVCVLARLHQPRHVLLLLYFVLSLLPGLVTWPNANHCLSTMPALYVFGALGLAAAAGMLASLADAAAWRWITRCAVVAVLAYGGVVCYRLHLVDPLKPVGGMRAEQSRAMHALRAAAPADAFIVLHRARVSPGIATYLLYPGQGTTLYRHGSVDYFTEAPAEQMHTFAPRPGRPTAFLLDMETAEWQQGYDRLRERFPSLAETEVRSLHTPEQVRWRILLAPAETAPPAPRDEPAPPTPAPSAVPSPTPAPLTNPTAVGPDGSVVVAIGGSDALVKYATSGGLLGYRTIERWLDAPPPFLGLAVDREGFVYLTDGAPNAVHLFSPVLGDVGDWEAPVAWPRIVEGDARADTLQLVGSDRAAPLSITLADVRAALLKNGLRARYWSNDRWEGEPLSTHTDARLDGACMLQRAYSVRWEGSIHLPAAGTWMVADRSRDGCNVWIDGNPVIARDELVPGEDHYGAFDAGDGPHAIRLDFRVTTPPGRCQVELRAPGATQFQPLSAFEMMP